MGCDVEVVGLTLVIYVAESLGYEKSVNPANKVLHGSAPQYLGPLVRVADLPCRRTLRSAGTNCLVAPRTLLN